MSAQSLRTLPEFNPSDPNSTAQEWDAYKRSFLIHLDALGLDDKPGKRKVGVLLANMGQEAIKIYDSFTWAPEVEADEQAGIQAVPAEDKHDLNTVFRKFDRHYGVHNYRNIKRQEFLNTKRGSKTIMDYISELKKKAEFCEYGDQREGFICDMIINGVNDRKCTEKLMEIPAVELTLDKVTQTCRQVELTKAHIDTLSENSVVNYARSSFPKRMSGSVGYQGKFPYCERCTKHHAVRHCPAFSKLCNECGVKGHFKASPLCKGRSRQYQQPRGRPHHRRGRGNGRTPQTPQRNVHYSDFQEPAQDVVDIFYQSMVQQCYTAFLENSFENVHMASSADSDWTVIFNVPGSPFDLELEIDSGARCSIISKEIAQRFTSIAPVHESNTVINGVFSPKFMVK